MGAEDHIPDRLPGFLSRHVLDRLPGAQLQPYDAPTFQRPACVRVLAKERVYILKPGAQRFEPGPADKRRCWEIPLLGERPFHPAHTGATEDVQRVVLHAQSFFCDVPVHVTEPAPIRHLDVSGRWKRARPSRRRYMKSWRYAPYQEKLWYAPLYRSGQHPYGTEPWAWPSWALHPHQLNRVRVGRAMVAIPFDVFRQDDDLEPHLRQLERDLGWEMHALLSRFECPPPKGKHDCL